MRLGLALTLTPNPHPHPHPSPSPNQSEIKPDLSKRRAAKTEAMLRRLSAADKNKTGTNAIDQAHS